MTRKCMNMAFFRKKRKVNALFERSWLGSLVIVFVFCATSLLAQNPTSGEIASGWSEMSGGLPGKIVYGTEETEKISVMDLATGESEVIADLELSTPESPNWWQPRCYCLRWSPDGNRIAFQNDVKVTVMNADGSNIQVLDTFVGMDNPDEIRHSWDGNDKIVYTDSRVIYSIGVNPDNTPGEKEVLFDDREPIQQSAGFASVGKSGKFLGFMELQGNLPTGGYHRDLVLNMETGELKDVVERDQDACQFIVKPDSSGTVMYARNNHIDPAMVVSFDVDVTNPNWMDNPDWVLDEVPPVNMNGNNMGIQVYSWANDVKYIVHMGGQQVDANHAWIRDMDTKDDVYLGDMVDYPDLYVGEPVSDVRKSSVEQRGLRVSAFGSRMLRIRVDLSEGHRISVYGPDGRLRFNQRATGAGDHFFPTKQQGVYYVLVESQSGLRLSKSFTAVH